MGNADAPESWNMKLSRIVEGLTWISSTTFNNADARGVKEPPKFPGILPDYFIGSHNEPP